MSAAKRVSNRVAFPIIFFSILTAGTFGVLLYVGASRLIAEVQPLLVTTGGQPSGGPLWPLVLFYLPRFWYTLFPALLVFALFTGLLAWLFVRARIRRLTEVGGTEAAPTVARRQKEKGNGAQRRMFLHLFAMMQREGRLMDFLAEDLERYQDAQIGSAVREIHAACRHLVQQYLDPKPIMEQDEGERVTVAADFDPGTIKLTGKVVGDPPFSGTVRHKGWRVGNLSLPSLTGRQNAEIIAPAEIEI